jgi:hypothetical protein
MGLLSLMLVLIVVGVALYLVETYIPMAPPIKLVLRIVVVLVLVIWLLGVFGVADIPVRRL